MTFTKEQLKTLSAWEYNFRTAVLADWANTPGSAGLRVIHEIFTSVTGDQRRFNDNCSNCILHLLRDCGKLYFKDLEELKRTETPAKVVALSEGSEMVIKKARVKVTRKPKKS